MSGKNNWILRSRWIADGSETGQMVLHLFGDDGGRFDETIRLAFTSLVRIPPGTELTGGRLVTRVANYHEIAPLSEQPAPDDGPLWTVTIPALTHAPGHATDGPNGAFLIFPDNATEPVTCEPMERDGPRQDNPTKAPCRPHSPQEREDPLLGLLPMANQVAISSWAKPPDHFTLRDVGHIPPSSVNGLFHRLFGEEWQPYRATGDGLSLSILPAPATLKDRNRRVYRLTFLGEHVSLEADDGNVFLGLVALGQIWRAARLEPERFGFPAMGVIEDWPHHGWRGMHLDVARQVHSKGSILRFLDILAYQRFNRLHLHLSDDEGWRLESRTYPQLTEIGAWRGHDLPLKPQHGSGPARYGGYYSRRDMGLILSHASSLGITLVPEIDIPGHCHAALMSVPGLLDPDAEAGGASVQGYVNNGLNPGLAETWTFLETIFGELSDLFPGPYIHMGGDEVAAGAWSGSPPLWTGPPKKALSMRKGRLIRTRCRGPCCALLQTGCKALAKRRLPGKKRQRVAASTLKAPS